MPEPIHFMGLLKSPASWAKVGRELVRALSACGAYVSAVSLKGYMYDGAYPLAEEVEAAVRRERREGWDLELDYPPNFARLNGRRKAGIVIYEADRLPGHWVDGITSCLDLVIVPSRFVLEAAVASGVPRGLLRLAPFGADTDVYRPDGPKAKSPTGRSFNFLVVGAAHARKGLAEACEAFTAAFGPGEDVGLVVKCPRLRGLGKRPWEYESVEDFLPDTRSGQIAVVEGTYCENEMAALYRGSDVYVQPSYGEAFGLAAVEAAACGTPVITTKWGAAEEVFGARSAYLVDGELVDASAISYDWRGAGPVRAARPRVTHLAQVMRRAYEDGNERQRLAKAALEGAAKLTWGATAKTVLAALSHPA